MKSDTKLKASNLDKFLKDHATKRKKSNAKLKASDQEKIE